MNAIVIDSSTLKSSLIKLGMSGSEFCRYIGVNRSSLQRWLKGSQPVPIYVQIIVSLALEKQALEIERGEK